MTQEQICGSLVFLVFGSFFALMLWLDRRGEKSLLEKIIVEDKIAPTDRMMLVKQTKEDLNNDRNIDMDSNI